MLLQICGSRINTAIVFRQQSLRTHSSRGQRFERSSRFPSQPVALYLEMVVAVLQVSAEGGQQLDAVGRNIFGAPLLQVGEADASVGPCLDESVIYRMHL